MNIKQIQASYRAWVNRHSALVTLGAIVALIVATVAIFFQLFPRQQPIDLNAFYYDLSNDKLFVTNTHEVPPITVPGQPPDAPQSGALAYVFACRDCADSADRYIGYVELYSPEAKKLLASLDAGGEPSVPDATFTKTVDNGHLIALPDAKNPNWKKNLVPFASREGQRIMEVSQTRCGETPPRLCSPRDAPDLAQ